MRALDKGEMDVAYGRIMLLGSAGVGKTSLKRSLMKLPWEPHTTSTVISDVSCVRPFGQQWYNINQEDDDKLVEVTFLDEIDELAKLLALVYHDPSSTMSAHSKITASALYPIASMINASSLSSHQIEDIEGADVNNILSRAILLSEKMSTDDLKCIKPQPFLHIWDCGGQPVFLEILPAFLTPRTMFLLMFDASKDFNERWQSVQHRAGHKIFDEVVNVTTLDLMLNWMASIYCHLIRQEQDGSLCEYPGMYCIGTHGDILKTKEEKKAVVEQIEYHYKDKAYFELIEDTLIIDNTTSGKGKDEDPNITILRRAICQFTHDKLIVRTPISWVLFRKVIQMFEKNVINLEEAHAIGVACKIPHDDVPKALLFYHDLGVVLFYPHIEGLKDKVIIKPKWFIDTLGNLFTLDGREGRKRKMLTLLQEKGILVETLYVSIWIGFTTELSPEAIIELLVNFRLAAPVTTKEYHDPTVKQFFLPAMLKSFKGDPSDAPHGYYFRATPLHIIFSTKFVPPGFFTRFVTSFTSNPLCKCSLVFKDGIYRNRVSFTYGEPPIDHIILTDLHFAIQVDVLRYAPDNPAFKSINAVCQKLLTVLQYCGQQVEQVLGSHRDLRSESFQSIPITKEFQYICKQCLKSSDPHYLMIGEEQLVNVPICCENNRSYRMPSAEEAVWFKGEILPKQDGVPVVGPYTTEQPLTQSERGHHDKSTENVMETIEEMPSKRMVASDANMSVVYLYATVQTTTQLRDIRHILSKVPTIKDAVSKLIPIKDKWFMIGTALEVSQEDLNGLDISRNLEEKNLTIMISKWKQEKAKEATWEALLDAVEGPMVKGLQVGKDIRDSLKNPNMFDQYANQ